MRLANDARASNFVHARQKEAAMVILSFLISRLSGSQIWYPGRASMRDCHAVDAARASDGKHD